MLIYILLILTIIVTSISVKLIVKKKEKQERIILFIGMTLIFLLLALKKETVGIDIAGYKRQYELSQGIAWNNWNYVYFENGYNLLQKLFSKSGMSFQIFTAIIYLTFCFSMYMFIKKYSKNVTLSLIILICYQFFVFSISGLRQTLAMAICLLAFYIHYEKKKTLWAYLVIIIAMQVHSSAVVFLCIPPLTRKNNKRVSIAAWGLVIVACIVFRNYIWRVIDLFYDVDIAAAVWGGNLLFIMGITVFIAISYLYFKGKMERMEQMLVRITMLSPIAYFVLCGSTLLRASMYFNMFYIISLPFFIQKYKAKERMALNIAVGMFLIILFYVETLAVNQLHLCPYRFFWQ